MIMGLDLNQRFAYSWTQHAFVLFVGAVSLMSDGVCGQSFNPCANHGACTKGNVYAERDEYCDVAYPYGGVIEEHNGDLYCNYNKPSELGLSGYQLDCGKCIICFGNVGNGDYPIGGQYPTDRAHYCKNQPKPTPPPPPLSRSPTSQPSSLPTDSPSTSTLAPSTAKHTSRSPTRAPTYAPTKRPTPTPTNHPTAVPTANQQTSLPPSASPTSTTHTQTPSPKNQISLPPSPSPTSAPHTQSPSASQQPIPPSPSPILTTQAPSTSSTTPSSGANTIIAVGTQLTPHSGPFTHTITTTAASRFSTTITQTTATTSSATPIDIAQTTTALSDVSGSTGASVSVFPVWLVVVPLIAVILLMGVVVGVVCMIRKSKQRQTSTPRPFLPNPMYAFGSSVQSTKSNDDEGSVFYESVSEFTRNNNVHINTTVYEKNDENNDEINNYEHNDVNVDENTDENNGESDGAVENTNPPNDTSPMYESITADTHDGFTGFELEV